MTIDEQTQEGLAVLAAHHGGDTATVLQRLVSHAVERLQNPDSQHRDPSPLHFGADTARIGVALLSATGGDRSEALRLLRADIRRRNPSFSTGKTKSPGFLEYDRIKSWLWRHRHCNQAV